MFTILRSTHEETLSK